MIYDTLENAQRYFCMNPHFKKAFDFINNTDLKNIAVGKYEIDGENVVAVIQEYTTMDNPPLGISRQPY